MTRTTTRNLFALALVPLLAMGALRPAAEADAGVGASGASEPRLELAVLKAEARQLVVHIDGP